ncbi:MAG: FkbM family methyltransferase [Bryobacterales bacterium]|nr:FkbM family methyltransferase [Bryobacterales bacterium]
MPHDIRSVIPFEIPAIHLLDAGAMSVGETPPYQSLLSWKQTKLFGFEPNALECARLNAKAESNTCYWPVALGDGNRHRFHVGRSEATSSLFPPNMALARKFNALAEFMEVKRELDIGTSRLDDIAGLPPLHYLKMDVQGAELMILQNALRQLESTVLLHLEVEFVPLYLGQPLFGDIDCFLRQQGFQFHRFASISGRTAQPFLMNGNPYEPMSQSLWADAIYMRNLETLPALPTEQLCRMAMLLDVLYQSFDIAGVVLEEAGRRLGAPLKERYIEQFAAQRSA